MDRAPTLTENLIADLIPPEELLDRGRKALSRRKRSGRSLKARVEDLEGWLGELTLLNETTLRLLLTKKVFTLAELREALRDVDLLDGVRDGKLTRKQADPEKKPGKKKTKGRKARRPRK
jgi:hypothetical protein